MENVHTDVWGCEELLSKFKSKFMLLYFVYDRLLFSLDTFDVADLDSTQRIFCISRTDLEVILLTKSKILDWIAFDCDSVRITLLRVNGGILSWKIVTK